jgi:hypothetical protein
MPSPKDGKSGNAVSPADPADAQEADKADPGAVETVKAEQIQSGSGKYGSANTKPYNPNQDPDSKQSWIEILLVDDDEQPVPGEVFYLTLPNGSVLKHTLDGKGFAHVELPEPGTCKVCFPRRDKDGWKAA